MFSKALLTTVLITAVSAHQNFHQFWINGETPGYQTGIRMPPSNSPVEDVTSNDMACNVGGSKVPSGVETIAASEGDTIKVQWDSSGHPGPITHFLFGPVDDASQATGIGAGWFKIDEVDYVDGKWANEIMQADGMTHEFKLPTGLASGEYLLRSEMLALHGAQTVGGAQFYIGCAQLKITGTGTAGSCGPTISLPGAYKAEDANIYIPNVYNGFDATTYKAPGGDVATCGGSGSGATPSKPSTTAAVPAPANSTVAAPETPVSTPVESPVESPVAAETSAAAPIATPAPEVPEVPTNGTAPAPIPSLAPTTFATLVRPSPTAAPTAGADVAKLWYQCGGVGWTGPTACVSGAKCVKQNEWYHQCLN
ncbi:endoglucanase-like protein II [Pyrenochaeta sp. DS3sAY3a]|nr:endoglucanase-like protein II [Pyrenochaeta sp. DS3sAY3a]